MGILSHLQSFKFPTVNEVTATPASASMLTPQLAINALGIADTVQLNGVADAVISVELPEHKVGLFANPLTVSCAKQKWIEHTAASSKYSFFIALDFTCKRYQQITDKYLQYCITL